MLPCQRHSQLTAVSGQTRYVALYRRSLTHDDARSGRGHQDGRPRAGDARAGAGTDIGRVGAREAGAGARGDEVGVTVGHEAAGVVGVHSQDAGRVQVGEALAPEVGDRRRSVQCMPIIASLT